MKLKHLGFNMEALERINGNRFLSVVKEKIRPEFSDLLCPLEVNDEKW